MTNDMADPSQSPSLDELEADLETIDAAEAPETAEQIARLLGTALDDIDGGNRSVAP